MILRQSFAALALAAAPLSAVRGQQVQHQVIPSVADPAVKKFDWPNVAITDPTLPAAAPLAVFLPGSSGRPLMSQLLLSTIAGQGYRVIGLEYDNSPAVVTICGGGAGNKDPNCSANFRQMRIDATGSGKWVSNPVAEAIVPRLVAMLLYLDKTYPAENWGRYLAGGQPVWDQIVVSGLSQGAGMAALIAKKYQVRRVVLFSSPWDYTGTKDMPAPWLSLPSATPMERWQAEYNSREKTVTLIKAAYAALAIPPANIRVFDLDLPPPPPVYTYHTVNIQDPRYIPQWQAMFGLGTDAPTTSGALEDEAIEPPARGSQ